MYIVKAEKKASLKPQGLELSYLIWSIVPPGQPPPSPSPPAKLFFLLIFFYWLGCDIPLPLGSVSTPFQNQGHAPLHSKFFFSIFHCSLFFLWLDHDRRRPPTGPGSLPLIFFQLFIVIFYGFDHEPPALRSGSPPPPLRHFSPIFLCFFSCIDCTMNWTPQRFHPIFCKI